MLACPVCCANTRSKSLNKSDVSACLLLDSHAPWLGADVADRCLCCFTHPTAYWRSWGEKKLFIKLFLKKKAIPQAYCALTTKMIIFHLSKSQQLFPGINFHNTPPVFLYWWLTGYFMHSLLWAHIASLWIWAAVRRVIFRRFTGDYPVTLRDVPQQISAASSPHKQETDATWLK